MGTTAEKLAYLEATKADIRAALVEKGIDVPESMPFRQYGDLIRTMISAPEKKALNNMTWDEISEVSKMGLAKSYVAVGDVKMIHVQGTVGSNLELDDDLGVFILGIDHNPSYQMPGIYFGCFKSSVINGKDVALVDNYYNQSPILSQDDIIFKRNYASGYGWSRDDTMRIKILGSANSGSGDDAPSNTTTEPRLGSLMAALPLDLRKVIRPMLVTVHENNYLRGIIDYLPLLSVCEVGGSSGWGDEEETQAQFDYYKAGNSTSKYRHSSQKLKARWWLRTKTSSNNRYFMVDTSGGVGGIEQYYSLGVSPMFLV